MMRECIDRVFRQYLTPRERKILNLYYGLESGAEAMTLERIGELLGVTRERIRQIRERAFDKLRTCPEGRNLAGFWAIT
jgi:RNA polymerase primary sigma factor